MLDFISLEESHVFVPEISPRMMTFLVMDVIDDALELRMTIGEGSKSFLPAKPAHNPAAPIDEIRRAVFHVANDIRQSNRRPETKEQMGVVRHTMNGQELLVPLADNAGNIFVELFLVLFLDHIRTALHSEDNLDVNL